MKKLTYILTFFVAVFVFAFLFQTISEVQYNQLENIGSAFTETMKKDCVLIQYQAVDEEGNNTYHELVDFIEEFHYDAVLFSEDMRYDFILDTTVYLYTEHLLSELDFFKTKNDIEIDFTKDSSSFYSSHMIDKGAIDTIDYIDAAYQKEYQPKLTVKQFKSIRDEQPKNDVVTLYIYSEDIESLVYNIENSKMRKYVLTDKIEVFDQIYIEEADVGGIEILLILSVFSLIVITICDLFQQKKEVTIRKLFGDNSFHIYLNLVAKRYLINLLIYVITQILLYIIIIGDIRSVHYLLLKPLFLALGMYIVVWVLANLVSYFTLTKIGKSTNLKQNNAVKFANAMTLIVKTTLIILMITPFISLFATAPDTLEQNIILRENESKMKGNLGIYGINDQGSDDSLDDIILLMMKHLEDYKLVYQEFSLNFIFSSMSDEMKKEMSEMSLNHPYIVVNEKYLEDYKIKDTNGKLIDTNTLENDTLLVPQTYKNDTFNEVYCNGPCDNIVYTQGGITFYSHNPLSLNNDFLRKKDPVILYKNKFDNSMNWNGSSLLIKNEKGTRERLNTFLEENDLVDVVFIEDRDFAYDVSISRSNDQVLAFFLTLCLYILMNFIFQYETVFVYFSEHKSEISVNYLFGKNYLQRYGQLFYSGLGAYVIPMFVGVIVLGVPFEFMLAYILFGFILDLIVSIIGALNSSGV